MLVDKQMVGSRFELAKVFGSRVIAKLIRQKKYRKDLTDYVDSLRQSNNFRERQMYITIAIAAFEVDEEIYKKHFAKAIGNEMLDEKVTVVKMLIAKLSEKVPQGYSKSTDKIADHFKAQNNSEVNQFFSQDNADISARRYLDPEKITTKMKAEEEDEEEKQAQGNTSEQEETKDSSTSTTTKTTTGSSSVKTSPRAAGQDASTNQEESKAENKSESALGGENGEE